MKTIRRFFIFLFQFLFARRYLAKVNRMIYRFSLRSLGVINIQTPFATGEPYLVKKILPQIIDKKSPVVFDVGANVGDYTSMIIDTFPETIIYAFEPHPSTFIKLKEKHKNKKNVSIFNWGLGSQIDQLTLYDKKKSDGSEQASLYKEVIEDIHHFETVSHRINIETIDNIVNKYNLETIDFLKIDTEGHEFEVLKGATSTLQVGKIKYIQFEFNEMNVISRVFIRDIQQILKDFTLYRLLPQGLLRISESIIDSEIFGFQNIFAIHKSCKQL